MPLNGVLQSKCNLQIGAEGKRLRPTMLVLMASSFAAALPSPLLLKVDESPVNHHPTEPRRRQQRIAEITEMIHVASLLHDDVIDNAETRRGLKALNSAMGNKIAILAGDFLLARASVSLASLRNTEVIELLSQVIEHLVSGEILQVWCCAACCSNSIQIALEQPSCAQALTEQMFTAFLDVQAVYAGLELSCTCNGGCACGLHFKCHSYFGLVRVVSNVKAYGDGVEYCIICCDAPCWPDSF